MSMAACCWERVGADNKLSVDSPFDKQLLEGFAKAVNGSKIVVCSYKNVKRRTLLGGRGIVVQYIEGHFDSERLGPNRSAEVVLRVDPEDFNFTKADSAEKVAIIDLLLPGNRAGVPTSVFACPTPVANGHVILVPRCEQLLPQVLTEDTMLMGLRLLEQSRRRDFRLFFNSPGTNAPVNHFHFHGLYLDYLNAPGSQLGIEKAERYRVSGDTTPGNLSVELLSEANWWARGFVLSAGCRKGLRGSEPAADCQALAALVARLTKEMQKRNVPHSVYVAPALEAKPPKVVAGEDGEEQEVPCALSPEVYLLPRRAAEVGARGPSAFEMAGLVRLTEEEVIDVVTEEGLHGYFIANCTPQGDVLDELICKAAWLSN
mmetsp:Transcript_48553/g.155095  ORF Transcript_48553/g.155095 Transcript_48553/m.155095 type:complete len:374 (-) Transcript_48553:39-1160(-)